MTLWQWLKLEWHWAVPALLLGAVVLGVCVRIVRNRRRVSAAVDEESTEQEIEHKVIEEETTVGASDVQLQNYDSVVAVDSRNLVGNGNNGTDEQCSTEEARYQRIRDGIEALHKAQVEQRERIEARTVSRTDRPREAPRRFQKPNHISTVVSAMLPKAISDQTGNGIERETRVESTTTTQTATGEDFRFITDLFDDPTTEVRNLAARALYQFQSDRAASFTRALREASPERRRRIGAALATSGLANEALTNLAGENLDKAYDAFSVLFLMAKAGEVQPLIKAIEDGNNIDVRLAVVKLLALSGQADVVSAFRRMAVRSSLPPELRSAVMEAIHQIATSK